MFSRNWKVFSLNIWSMINYYYLLSTILTTCTVTEKIYLHWGSFVKKFNHSDGNHSVKWLMLTIKSALSCVVCSSMLVNADRRGGVAICTRAVELRVFHEPPVLSQHTTQNATLSSIKKTLTSPDPVILNPKKTLTTHLNLFLHTRVSISWLNLLNGKSKTVACFWSAVINGGEAIHFKIMCYCIILQKRLPQKFCLSNGGRPGYTLCSSKSIANVNQQPSYFLSYQKHCEVDPMRACALPITASGSILW